MSRLTVYHRSTPDIPNKVLSHPEDIAATLAELGIGFERAEATLSVKHEASPEEVITICRSEIEAWMARDGYLSVDAISVDSDRSPDISSHADLLREHRLGGAWVLCVVAGRVQLNLHVGDYVYAVLCERNDRIIVPAGVRHWLDLGERARFIGVRVLAEPHGWQPDYVDQPVHGLFPRFDD